MKIVIDISDCLFEVIKKSGSGAPKVIDDAIINGIPLPKNHERRMSIEDIYNTINEFNRQILEEKQRTLTEIITKYDFFVGSKELKVKLTEILPEGANIVYSPFIEDVTMIYAVKKFDVMDLLLETYKAESEKE